MANWTKYIDEADRYSKAAIGSFKKEKLGSLVVYNVLSMAVENYLTALCVSTDDMPEHSGITAMLKQIGKKMEIPEEFHVEARFMVYKIKPTALQLAPHYNILSMQW